MKGSDTVVKCLESEGIERIFGIPGEENLDLMDSLRDSSIEFVLTRHESSAAFMAGMTGRLTTKPGVCLTTLGPGAANMVIGVGEAYLGYQPMVAISGQLSRECQRWPRKQYLDLMSVFRPITKDAISVSSAAVIPEAVGQAFSVAGAERPGPVYLELPEDVMRQRTEGGPITLPLAHTAQSAADVGDLAELISSAQRPIMLAGAGVVRSHATAELVRFAERWSLPTAMTWLGTGSVPFDHPLSLGTVGLRKADVMRPAFEATDLVILAGFDPMEFEAQYWNFGTAKKVIYIGAAPCDAAPGLAPDRQVIGDLRRTLMALDGEARGGEVWTAGLKAKLADALSAVPPETKGVKPQAIVRAIRNSLGREDIAVSDVGAHLIWIAQRYPVYKENTLLMSNGLIPMGVGVPWAIAAKLAYPERKVVASVGDGSFMMTGMELRTAKEQGTPFVTVVWNDSELALIRIKSEKAFGRSHGIEFTNPDIVKYAESMGATGYRVSTSAELDELLGRCIKNEELAVIDVAVDREETARLTPS